MRNKCPECGGRLEATVQCYINVLELGDDDEIISWEPAFSDARGNPGLEASIAFEAEVRIYCENDHQIARY